MDQFTTPRVRVLIAVQTPRGDTGTFAQLNLMGCDVLSTAGDMSRLEEMCRREHPDLILAEPGFLRSVGAERIDDLGVPVMGLAARLAGVDSHTRRLAKTWIDLSNEPHDAFTHIERALRSARVSEPSSVSTCEACHWFG